MNIGSILFLSLICVIARCFIFYKRDIKWWKSFIPIYNKYLMGKISGSKKLGIINAILIPLFDIYFFICFCYELWLVETYSVSATVPYNTDIDSKIEVAVPEDIANVAIYSKYILLALFAVTFIAWCSLCFKFIKANNTSYWWILLWAFAPIIPYCYFAIKNDVYIDGKHYKLQLIEINNDDKSVNKKEKDSDKKVSSKVVSIKDKLKNKQLEDKKITRKNKAVKEG